MTDQPRRIQRKRTRGWRMPPGAVYVGRPGQWSNPYRVHTVTRSGIDVHVITTTATTMQGEWLDEDDALTHVVDLFRQLAHRPAWAERIPQLRGRDLACWCPPRRPCHADVLLELANPGWAPRA